MSPGPSEGRLAPPDQDTRVADGRGQDTHAWSRAPASTLGRPEHSGQHSRPPVPASLASLAAAGRSAAESASDQEIGLVRPAGKAPGHGKAAREAKRDRKARRSPGRKGREDEAVTASISTGETAAIITGPARAVAVSAATVPARADGAAALGAAPVRPRPLDSAPVGTAPAATAPGTKAPATRRKDDPVRETGRRAARRKVRHPVRLAIGGGTVAVVAAAAAVLVPHALSGYRGPAHSISTPSKLQAYVQDPALAAGMGAQALRAEIVKKGNGEASHVVDAVYEDSAGPGAKSNPLILLFVGGNLSGSAGSFISSFKGLLPSAFVTGPGSLGGQAACVPGVGGHPAECAWADGDTFGLIASPALSASGLARELRLMRPLVEHVVK
jgi:hypothetical protein